MRTTVDIEDPILREVKALQKREGKSLGRVVSELLAAGLAGKRPHSGPPRAGFVWTSKPMRAQVDLADRDAVYTAMEEKAG